MDGFDRKNDDGAAFILSAGPFQLDSREGRLTKDGARLDLNGKPLALLETLMRSGQRLVAKEEIFDRVWLGRAVSEAVLTTAIRQIRSALGDDARNPTIIETVHGRGYRFLLPVARVDRETAETFEVPSAAAPVVGPPARGIRPVLAALAAACLAAIAAAAFLYSPVQDKAVARFASPESIAGGEKSLAIRPFANNGGPPGEEWFAEGLTWEILATLAKTPDIKLASMKAAEKIQEEESDAQSFGRALGVAYVLDGIVRREKEIVRVTASLTRISDGAVIWAENFQRSENDVISIQEEIACDIGRALNTIIDPKRFHAMVAAGTQSPDAYYAYLQGVAYGKRALSEGGEDYVRKSAEAFESARTLDPGFAAAQWAAAQSWFGNTTRVDSKAFDGVVSRDEQLARYIERVDAAIAATGDSVDALKYRAARASMRLQFLAAQELLENYIKERPRDIDAWEQLGAIALYAGDRKTAANAARKMHALAIEAGEPLSRAITVSVMSLELEQAAQMAREQLRLSPDNAILNYQAQRAFLWTEDFDSARKALEFMRASDMDPVTVNLAAIRQACAEGRTRDAMALRAKVDADGPLGAKWQAAMLSGDRAAAHRLLEPFDTPGGLPTLMQFLFQPVFDEREFPVLAERIAVEGVKRPPTIEMPHACKLHTSAFVAE